MPNITNQRLTVTKITSDSITISWERWTGCTVNPDPTIYKVGIKESNNPSDPWRIVKQGKGLYSHTFTGLKSDVSYAFYVKAYDESGQVCQYPLSNGSMWAKTMAPAPDTVPPTVKNKALTVTRTTSKTIAIKWEPASDNVTAAKDINYIVGLTEVNNPNDPWHIVQQEKNISSYTFKGLKPGTKYGFYVKAFDEAGNVVQYPLDNGCMTATTKAADTEPPTVKNKSITVLEASDNQIIIRWEPSTDNETAVKDIRYQVYLTIANDPSDPWHLVKDAKNITTYTFTGLKNKTTYGFFVRAFDQAGNVLQYPLDNGCMTAVTDSANSKLVIQKGGSVYCNGVYGSGAVCLREDMGSKFNRDYFEISFDFYPLATDKDDINLDNIFTIDTSCRVFGFIMKNGHLHVSVNNDWTHSIDVGIRYTPNKWQSLWMVYDHGTLKVNGVVTLKIGKLNGPGNNIFTSVRHSNGHTFKGYIKDLIVKTK